MAYNFTINDFEGPLDLLLHLIQKKEKDIIEINVNEIAEQYVNFIKNQDITNLEISSEYLVLAAYLIELKSKAVLPLEEELVEGDFQELERQKLIEKLIKYKKYKDTLTFFENSLEERNKIYIKEPMNLNFLEVPLEERGFSKSLDMNKLSESLSKMFKRLDRVKPVNTLVSLAPINLEQRESEMTFMLFNKKIMKLEEFFIERRDKQWVIATIVCMLDLTKNGFIKINQDHDFDFITLERKEL